MGESKAVGRPEKGDGFMLRVAAYCRVSTDKEDQQHSLESQLRYFGDYIGARADWTMAGMYADEGLSGTGTRKRAAFRQMMADAREGRLDLILTKEVSRFARNTVDALESTRTLRRCGVGVVFLSDNIDTRENDGELRLTIMASIAQEESRRTSQRVKWGQKRRMEQGVVFGNNSIYGFDLQGGQLRVVEREAEVVRAIYRKYVTEGKGTHVIARELYEAGVDPPASPSGRWSPAMVRRVLRNEKYCGDLVQKKEITVDFLTHLRRENRGEEELVCLHDHHEAILPRAVWEQAQKELQRRRGGRSGTGRRCWCSGKVRCGLCGGRFVLRTARRPNGDQYRGWICSSHVYRREKQPCPAGMVNQKTLEACVGFVFGLLLPCPDEAARRLAEELDGLPGGEKRERRARMAGQLEKLQQRKVRMLDAYFDGTIEKKEMEALRDKYDREREELERRLEELAGIAASSGRSEREEGGYAAVRDSLRGPGEVFAAAVREITVYEAALRISMEGLSGQLEMRYVSSGRRASYRTEILGWRLLDEAGK